MSSGGLQLRGVYKTFQTGNGRLPVLEGISFGQNQGEVVSIVGASGSGKTTLLRIVAGLEKPDSGSIALNGKPVTGPGPERAMIFQQFGLMPWLSVLNNVMFGLETSPLNREQKLAAARDAIRRVGLTGFEDFLPKTLSGGMQQRVGIARALAVRPTLLLCDEPFASVDAMTRQYMQTDLLDIVTRDRIAAGAAGAAATASPSSCWPGAGPTPSLSTSGIRPTCGSRAGAASECRPGPPGSAVPAARRTPAPGRRGTAPPRCRG